MMGSTGMFKFLKPSMRPQPTDIQAAVGWGVAAATAGLYLVQVHLFLLVYFSCLTILSKLMCFY